MILSFDIEFKVLKMRGYNHIVVRKYLFRRNNTYP